MRISIEAIKTYSGADVFFETLYQELSKVADFEVSLSWHASWKRFIPQLLSCRGSNNTDIVISNIEYGYRFQHKDSKLILTAHQCVFDPEYQQHTSVLQKLFHYGILWNATKNGIKKADQVVSCSKSVKSLLMNSFGKHSNEVIYNGVDCSLFTVGNEAMSTKTYKILYVGNLVKRKGVLHLPKIADELGSDYHIYYTEGLRKTKQQESLRHPLLTSIGTLSHDQLVKHYQSADVLVLPTKHEGFGYVVAEAFACGLPCVTSDVNAMIELNIDGETGYICKKDDVYAYAENIKKICSNTNLHGAMSLQCRKRAVSTFSLDKQIQQYVTLMHQCASSL